MFAYDESDVINWRPCIFWFFFLYYYRKHSISGNNNRARATYSIWWLNRSPHIHTMPCSICTADNTAVADGRPTWTHSCRMYIWFYCKIHSSHLLQYALFIIIIIKLVLAYVKHTCSERCTILSSFQFSFWIWAQTHRQTHGHGILLGNR